MADQEFPTEGDQTYQRYKLLGEHRDENDIPGDDLLPHDTRITQSLSEPETHPSEHDDARQDVALPDVPDADDTTKDSPVDPAAPDPDAMHGTDLINGYDGDESE